MRIRIEQTTITGQSSSMVSDWRRTDHLYVALIEDESGNILYESPTYDNRDEAYRDATAHRREAWEDSRTR